MDLDVVGSDEDVALIDQDDISNYNPENILPESPEVIGRIRKWLEPTAYDLESGEYRRHLASHLDGTGQWLLDAPTYQQWHDSSDYGLLWVKGIPGSGKSVFAATLAHELAKEGHPVLLFFFRQIIDANHQPINLLHDWLEQIVSYSPPLQRDLKDFVDDRNYRQKELKSLGMDALWTHLKTALAHMSKVYLVADALDEMDKGHDEFLKALAQLGSWKPATVKVLITSRPVPTIEAPLREYPALKIRLEERLVDIDIATYVQHRMRDSSIPVDDQSLIKEAVPGHARGLFLYAKLAMDAFLEPQADVRKVLTTLPGDLNAMYNDLLLEHARRSEIPSDIQLLILCWVTHATRPLRLIELAEVVRSIYTLDTSTDLDLKGAKVLVKEACGPLLEIQPDETISVIHHSFTEFLVGATRSVNDLLGTKSSQVFPILTPGPTHERLALACLGYLQAGSLDSAIIPSKPVQDDSSDEYDEIPWYENEQLRKSQTTMRLQFPFVQYASKHWPIHVTKAAGSGASSMSSELVSALDQLLTPGPRFETWLNMEWDPRLTKGVTPYHVAAQHGLSQYLELLVLARGVTGPELDPIDCLKQTPLFYAAENGHEAAVRVLIDAGVNPNSDNYNGLTPLHRAAAHNHGGVIRLLLAAGVDPLTKKTREDPGNWCGNASRTVGHTALMYACQAGHHDALEAFLPFLNDDVEAVHRALNWASGTAHPRLVKRLLQHPGIDVNAKVNRNTFLFSACRVRDVESIEALLSAGADATILCAGDDDEFAGVGGHNWGFFDSTSPLEIFCSSQRGWGCGGIGFEAMRHGLDLLLGAGADINRRNPDDRTPLHCAAHDPVMLRLLLDRGADPSVESSDGSTLLHTPQQTEEGWEMVKLLVQEGKIDVNKRRHSDGYTPLICYLKVHDWTNATRFIDECHPDCTMPDSEGDTPLHLVVKSYMGIPGKGAILADKLVAHGAKLSQRNHRGEMPIHVAQSPRWDPGMVKHLVVLGADLEARDLAGATKFMRSVDEFWTRDFKTVSAFLDIGARLDTRDNKGRTLLHEITANIHRCSSVSDMRPTDMLRHFLDLGMDHRAVDYSGNTLLHELVTRKANAELRVPFFRELLRLGLDPDAENHTGRTMLHLICSGVGGFGESADNAALDLALGECKRIDGMDHEGFRPIHLASSLSEYFLQRLILAGADISSSTNRGLTPLHLAARARRTNIVGMLLNAIATGRYGQPDTIINALDGDKVPPLYYACLSGRPETVSLLLDAGARVKEFTTVLRRACLGFEPENKLWTQKRHGISGVAQPPNLSPLAWQGKKTWQIVEDCYQDQRKVLDSEHKSTRLEEIVGMLLHHGLDLQGMKTTVGDLEASLSLKHTSASRERIDSVLRTNPSSAPAPPAVTSAAVYPWGILHDDSLDDFIARWDELRRTSGAQAFGDTDPVKKAMGKPDRQERLLVQLLHSREYGLVEAAFGSGGCDPCLANSHGDTALGMLARFGYADLLAKLADPTTRVTMFDSMILGSDKKVAATFRERPVSINPLVLIACERELPNMDVLRFLVETAKASVNAQRMEPEVVSGGDGYRYGARAAPLHCLAAGKHWWQVYEALPYVLSRKPDLEIRNESGHTSLHTALTSPGPSNPYGTSVFKTAAARLLVEAGADVNAVSKDGTPCLAMVGNDVELVHLLVAHGARITPPALFAAIDTEEVEVLKALLAAAPTGDANMRHDKLAAAAREKTTPYSFRHDPSHVPEYEKYPLYHAATKSRERKGTDVDDKDSESRRTQMVSALLASGADPFARFWMPAETEDDDDDDDDDNDVVDKLEQATVIHQILSHKGIIQPFLQLPNLDLEHGDSKGRTLLLAACASTSGIQRTIKLDNMNGKSEEDRLLIEILLERGADITVVDTSGRNALHLPFISTSWSSGSNHWFSGDIDPKPLQVLLTANPKLVSQVDKTKGRTALHYAILAISSTSQSECTSVNLLLDAGADPHTVDAVDGNNALHCISKVLSDNPHVHALFSRLLGMGVDINGRNARGETPLACFFEAAASDRRRDFGRFGDDVWKLFEDAGADVAARDNKGRTLMHVVAGGEHGSALMFGTLLEHGLDPMIQDDKELTSLDVAAACGKEKILALFEKNEGKK
ncbi:ankyrin repeat-containing domain protein [Apodospora peruviana]|uniref:Ankyrin repeat-containing domain protein n=1 Tax=Apodospora peruviana TaxID=516989 RepID=A0AAE0IKJ2_9PEZI|nr:ankyrin repeat-containing domain protein [Apodospora peruviana]